MLKKLSIKNLRSIKDEVLFSMEADTSRVSEHKDHIINACNNDILKVSSMYGPNGGGKSNFLIALNVIKDLVLLNNQPSPLPMRKLACEFSNSNEIEETVFFINEEYEIGYYFKVTPKSIQQQTLNLQGLPTDYFLNYFEVVEETISFRKKDSSEFIELLTRDSSGHIESELLENIGLKIGQNISNNISCVSYIYTTYLYGQNLINDELKVISSLINEINSIIPLEAKNTFNLKTAKDTIIKYKEQIIDILNDVDIKISDIILEKDKYHPICFERKVLIEGQLQNKTLDLGDESSGTQKIFWMFLNLLKAKDSNQSTIFLCDDMNAFLHPKLYRAVIELFNSKDNNKIQLIFNSHDILNMDKELFRRDEIWFIYRDDSYQTKAIPLSNIVNFKGEQVRKDATYYKQYLEGKYGADPFIKKGLSWNE